MLRKEIEVKRISKSTIVINLGEVWVIKRRKYSKLTKLFNSSIR